MMKIKITNGVATGYFKYSYSNVRRSPLTIYDVLNIFQYNYGLETYLYHDMEHAMYYICATGSITIMMSLRTMLRHVYTLVDLAES